MKSFTLHCLAAALCACAALAGCGEPAWRASAASSSPRTGAGVAATRFGQPLRVQGRSVQAGDPAPDVVLSDTGAADVRLSDFRGRIVLLSVVPDINTPVCSSTTLRLEHEAPHLGDGVAVVTVSGDSPFVQERWMETNDCSAVRMLSDSRRRAFGRAFGVGVEGEDVLVRSMFVIDREGILRHVELVGEQADAPDEDAALAVVRRLKAGG